METLALIATALTAIGSARLGCAVIAARAAHCLFWLRAPRGLNKVVGSVIALAGGWPLVDASIAFTAAF